MRIRFRQDCQIFPQDVLDRLFDRALKELEQQHSDLSFSPRAKDSTKAHGDPRGGTPPSNFLTNKLGMGSFSHLNQGGTPTSFKNDERKGYGEYLNNFKGLTHG